MLAPEDSYSIEYPWLVEGGLPGFQHPVIHLRFQLGANEVLAVAYTDESSGIPVSVGTNNQAEFDAQDDVLMKPAGQYLLKMLKPRFDDLPDDSTGFTDKNKPWYPALGYELRNYYDLGGRDIALSTLSLTIRQLKAGEATNPETIPDPRPASSTYGQDVPLVKVLGLDQRGRAGSAFPDSSDGLIDDQFIDPVTGIVFFPDIHPFAPDSFPPDPSFACAPGHGPSGPVAVEHADHAGPRDARAHLEAGGVQPLGDDLGGPPLLEAQLGMAVEVTTERDQALPAVVDLGAPFRRGLAHGRLLAGQVE